MLKTAENFKEIILSKNMETVFFVSCRNGCIHACKHFADFACGCE